MQCVIYIQHKTPAANLQVLIKFEISDRQIINYNHKLHNIQVIQLSCTQVSHHFAFISKHVVQGLHKQTAYRILNLYSLMIL